MLEVLENTVWFWFENFIYLSSLSIQFQVDFTNIIAHNLDKNRVNNDHHNKEDEKLNDGHNCLINKPNHSSKAFKNSHEKHGFSQSNENKQSIH